MKYYSAIDRFFNRFRKKGFLLYATLVIAATAYSFYSISNLPDVTELKELKEQQKKKKEQQLKKLEEDKKKEEADNKKKKELESPSKKLSSRLFVDEELLKDHSNIDNWSRKELHSYLSRHKIYPDLDTTLEDLIEQVKFIYYENKVAHFI